MNTAHLLDVFDREMRCEYKGRVYLVRDNGAICRLRSAGSRSTKLDNVWTFGKPNEKTGYMELASQSVHRIVAFAFHGNPPTDKYVVDHVDTNRRNNRPENLRWVTRLENVLNNPITRARIENIFGSVEAFLLDPSKLRGHEKIDPNFSWMRAVSPEEAHNSLERLTNWSKERPKSQGGSLGEWVFQEQSTRYSTSLGSVESFLPKPMDDYSDDTKEREPLKTQSLTPNAKQLDWKHPVEFPCCPLQFTENPLGTYMANMAEGKVFSKNQFGESTILKFGMKDSENLWVMCNINIGWKTHAITQITYKDGFFYHENMGVYDIGDDPDVIFDSFLNGE